ncbi:MAG: DNA polymerase III subunit delta' C-terminal domain-containing protein [Dehalococcoidales bacterium]|nr:DNA polymerase III subunit delta' C-terminal domain-containing protein [Dehalococcoidales bacterium]
MVELGLYDMWQVVGQNKTVSLIKHSLEKKILAHAYIFVGPAHVGKKTLAFNLAQAVNCEAYEPPCGECLSCQKIASEKHADVQIIGVTTNVDTNDTKVRTEISIDQIRQIQHSASFPPFEGKFKVFIIDGAELLSMEAANSLHKTLEEPLDKIIFILLTTDDKLLPATVVSRCQRLELLPVAVAEIEAALNNHQDIEPQRAKLIARLSHGRMGWALMTALDDEMLKQYNEKMQKIINIINADYEERFAYAAELAVHFNQRRELVQELLDLWIDWWRDLLLAKIGCKESITNIDLEEMLIKSAQDYRLEEIRTFINSIQETKEQLGKNVNPQLALEVLMFSIPEREENF